MIDYVLKNIPNPLSAIKVDIGVDQPLYKYCMKAIQDIEVLNILTYYKYDESIPSP